MPRKSQLAAVVAVLCISLALAPSATADKPIIEPAPFGEFTGQYCEDFLVRVRETTNRGAAKIFSDGSVIITGTLKVDVTNLETGKTISLNISGPAMFSSDGTTLVGVGTWLFFGEAGFLGRPSPTLETFNGRFTLDLADGTFVRRTGAVRELCAELA
jgi:hypothetical protein